MFTKLNILIFLQTFCESQIKILVEAIGQEYAYIIKELVRSSRNYGSEFLFFSLLLSV